MLRTVAGAELEQQMRDRHEAASSDSALAWGKVEALSKLLLELDAHATMDVAPNPERPGTYVLNKLTFKGHLMVTRRASSHCDRRAAARKRAWQMLHLPFC